ncbi:HTH-like domain-containing protein [Geodermatophilus saharensis]|uniref:HTH-like domain-containing protein n=1 Tax=Geodermatophilus saharensis TaxID=1137994 RepID=A0A239HWX9_9ACTN|nr:IS3 family transposase [Geodermatophilus saharensis]SNS85896.1 HTH-like domain-containing protein [Geodermatophilus saharensis]
MIVDYLDEHQERFGVEPICRVLTDAGTKTVPSTYYAAKTGSPSARSLSDAATTRGIERVHEENFGVYGVREVHAALRRQGPLPRRRPSADAGR